MSPHSIYIKPCISNATELMILLQYNINYYISLYVRHTSDCFNVSYLKFYKH